MEELGKIWCHNRRKLAHIPFYTREYTAHENSHRSTTQILGLYLKFERQNLGYLSPTFLEAEFGALTRISEEKFWGQAPRLSNTVVPPGNNSRAKGNFSGLFPAGIWAVCQISKAISNDQKFTSISLYGYFLE